MASKEDAEIKTGPCQFQTLLLSLGHTQPGPWVPMAPLGYKEGGCGPVLNSLGGKRKLLICREDEGGC